MRTRILILLLTLSACLGAQTIKNSSIAVQANIDNTVPFPFAPQFRFDTTSFKLYAFKDGIWKILADGSTSMDADSVAVDTTGLQVIKETNLQDYIVKNDAAILKACGTEIIAGTGKVTANADPTKFDVSAGVGQIKDGDDYYAISFPAQTAIPINTIASNTSTWVYVDNAGTIGQQTTQPTAAQFRQRLYLHRIPTSATEGIFPGEVVKNPAGQYTNQVRDLASYFPPLKRGFTLSPNANLTFAVTAGSIYKVGANADANSNDPNTVTITLKASAAFFLMKRDATLNPAATTVPVTQYDLNGALTTLTNNRFVIHTVFQFVSGNLSLQYGQAEYTSLDAAQTAISTRTFVRNPANDNAVRLGWIIVEKNATNLQSTSTTRFIQDLGQFNTAAGAAAGALLAANNLSDVENATTARTNIGAGIVETIVAGTGMGVDATDPKNPIVTNTSPDQTVTLTEGANMTITGTYPDFTLAASGGGSSAIVYAATIPAGSLTSISTYGFAPVYSNSSGTILAASTTSATTLHQYYVKGTSGAAEIVSGQQSITASFSYVVGTTYYLNDSGTLSTSADNDGDAIDFDSACVYVIANLGSSNYLVNLKEPRHFINN